MIDPLTDRLIDWSLDWLIDWLIEWRKSVSLILFIRQFYSFENLLIIFCFCPQCDRLLDEELNSDLQLKKQFGDRWNRMPSSQLSEPLRAESGKYRAILTNAEKADGIVREKYQKHERGMTMLSGTVDQLVKAVPSTNPVQGLLSSPAVKSLRELLDTVKTITVTRENAENDLKMKSATVDISKFTNSINPGHIVLVSSSVLMIDSSVA